MTSPIPGQAWSSQLPDSSTLRILRVAGRNTADHFVLTLDNLPIVPPFQSLTNALIYVTREWVTVDVVARL